MSDSNVVPFRSEPYPVCPTCRHEWHGMPCAATRWSPTGTRPGLCLCQTSVDSDTDDAA